MAAIVSPDVITSIGYFGLAAIFEYTNWDGKLCRTNCGQAAAATYLTHLGKVVADIAQANRIMTTLERRHPPDQLGGLFGTGRRRVERICRAFGVHVREIRGEQALRDNLTQRRPVIVMLGMSPGQLWNRFDLPGGHWMVAYGFDADHIFLTNHGKMTWTEFRSGWSSLVPRLIRMNGRGLVVPGR
jgi:hypothetical protein